MTLNEERKNIVHKTVYKEPEFHIINYPKEDILTVSGDENQGEWDPQAFALKIGKRKDRRS